MPMSFIEIDEAKAEAARLAPSGKRGKKRKNATIARLNPSSTLAPSGANGTNGLMDEKGNGESSDLRTGRWTSEETAYCDQLIEKFERGLLPIVDGIKLNDFLSNMLKSKQSRLTKKMKNARLSARCYKRTVGFINDDTDARLFSEAESSFFDSIPCSLEKSEIKFHMQKEWRELYSSYCVAINQKLDADGWLSSVEELDRRASEAKDAARMARRKVMMGYALSQDSVNPDRGVFIEPNATTDSAGACCSTAPGAAVPSMGDTSTGNNKNKKQKVACRRHFSSSPFVGRVVEFLQRYNIPFEHVDAWVPSFVPQQPGSADTSAGANTGEQKCRLCFAGSATTDAIIPAQGGSAIPLTQEEHFDLVSFGEYSQKFSFDLGCGLPGRVYSSGVASWEQGIQKAPSTLFERCGGASQWSIQTVLGIPVPSPNVGRVVVLLYSRFDRNRDQDTVNRISSALSKLMPTPKWKLVVDVGAPAKAEPARAAQASSAGQVDNRANELLQLMRAYTPANKSSPLAVYLPGFTSLRLLLEKGAKTPREEDLAHTLTESYSSYLRTGRAPSEIAWMVARDYMVLSQHSAPAAQPHQNVPQLQHVQQQQHVPQQCVQHHQQQQHVQVQQVQQIQHQVQQHRHSQPATQTQHSQVQVQQIQPVQQQLQHVHTQQTAQTQHQQQTAYSSVASAGAPPSAPAAHTQNQQQFGLTTNAPAAQTTQQQLYTNAQAAAQQAAQQAAQAAAQAAAQQAAQQQAIPLTMQQLQTFDFPHQLPGQPSA